MRVRRSLILTALLAGLVLPLSALPASASPRASAGSFIVTLKHGTDARAVAAEYHRRDGVDVSYVYTAALDGFAGQLSEGALGKLRADGRVERIERDGSVHATDWVAEDPAPSWGLDRIDQIGLPLDSSYTYDSATAGAGVHAYVIDTGIEVSHPDFGGRATNGWDFVSGDAVAEDCNGHGTHVSGTIGGTIYGVAKQVALVAVRVLNCAGSGTYSGVIAGIDWVAANHVGPSVANMSLGGGKSFSLNDAVNGAVASGVTFAVAAGNSAADACDYSPASAASALTVGATTSSDARASYSNYGSCLDLFAPGSGITSDWKGGGTNTISGTSMATPHVTGAAALYLGAHPSASPNTVGSALLSDAVSGTVSSPGSGSPNELLHVVVGTASTPPPSGGGNTAPTATITSKSCNGTTCSFAGSASDPDAGDSVTLAWDLGNGTTASGTSATATYGAGKYTVSLTATDSQGATGTATTSVNCVAKGKSKYISCN